MSGTSQQLKVTFSAETSQLLTAIDQVNQKIGATTAGMQRAQASASAAQAGLSQAWEQAGRAMDLAAKAAVALGVAMAGMKVTELAGAATMSAARFETMGVVLNRLAQNTQYSASQVGQFATGVEGMGITMTGSREVIARMIQAQIDLAQATRLARVAQDAAVIGNMNSSEALEHLVYGIQSAQVEMLRTLGLNVSFEQSYERLAASLNKPVDALTEVEKTQARVTAALQAGANIAGAYEASMGTAGKQLASMSRLVEDFQTKLGEAFLPAFTAGVHSASQALAGMNKALDSPTGRAALDGVGDAMRRIAVESQAFIGPLAAGLSVTVVGAAVNAARAIGLVSLAGTALSTAFGGWVLPIAAATGALTYFIAGQSRAITAAQQTSELLTRETALRSGATTALERQTQAQRDLNAAREQAATRGLERDLTDQRGRNAAALSGLRGFIGSAAFERQVPRAGAFAEADVLGAASGDRSLAFAQYVRAFQDFANSTAPVNEAVKQLADRLQALDEAQKRAGQSTQFGRAELRAWVQTLQEGVPAAELLQQRIEGLKNALNAPGAPAFDLAGSQAQITRMLDALNLKQMGNSIVPEDIQKALTLQTAAADQVERLRNAYAQTQAYMADMQPGTAQWNAKLLEAEGIAQQLSLIMGNWPAIMQATRDATAGIMDFAEQKPGWNPPSGGGGGDSGLRDAEIRADWAQRIAEAEALGAYAVRQATAEMEKLVAASKGGTALAEAAARAREAEAKAIGDAVAQARNLARESQQNIDLSLAQLQGPGQAAAVQRAQEQQRLLRALGPNQPDAMALGMGAFDWKQIDAAVSSMAQIGMQAQKATAAAEAELAVLGQSNAEREKAVALAELRLQYETAIAGASEEQRAKLSEAYNAASNYVSRLAAVKEQVEAAQRIQDAMKQAGDAIGQAFEEAVLQGKNLNQVLNSLMQTLLQIFAKQMVFAPLQNLFSTGASSLFGGGGGLGGLLSGLLGGGGSGQWANIPGVAGWYAQGGTPNAAGLGAYRNSFVSKPTIFPFAKGGAMGLMGEAGTEAIFPVFRTRNGDLGVKVGNDNSPNGGRGGDVQVNVYAPPGSSVQQEQRQNGDSRAIDIFIDGAMAGNMRPGTKTHRALRDGYGARNQIIRR